MLNCEGYVAALAHNVLTMVRRLGRGVGPPRPVAPAAPMTAREGHTTDDAVSFYAAAPWRSGWLNWLTIHLTPALR